MTKKQKWLIIGILVFIFLGIVSGICFFFYDFLKDKEDTRKEMSKIQEEYVSFKKSIETYNDMRDQVYELVFKDVYYVDMEEKDASRKNVLDKAYQVVKTVSSTSKSLKKACDGVIYPEASINTKCSSFAIAYEQVVNSFVSDVDSYNNHLTSYNEWASKNGKLPLKEYKTSLKYIDYDKDKVYSGKENLEDE